MGKESTKDFNIFKQPKAGQGAPGHKLHPEAPSLYLGLNTSTPQPDPNSLLQP